MAASTINLVDRVLEDFNSGIVKPEDFLRIQNANFLKFKNVTKQLYDHGSHNFPIKGISGNLPELFIEGFEEEQIWQQLELNNTPAFDTLMKNVVKLLAVKPKQLSFKTIVEEKGAEEEDQQAEDDGASNASDLSEVPDVSDEEYDDSDEDETDLLKFDEYKVLDEEDRPSKALPERKHKKSVVDDQFFKLGEMEEYLQKDEGRKPEKDDEDDEDSIDFFEDFPSDDDEDDEAVNAKYSDFFKGSLAEGKVLKRKKTEDAGSGDSEGDDEELDQGDEDIDDEENSEGEDAFEPQEKRVKFNMDESESGSDEEEEEIVTKAVVKSNLEKRDERLRARIEDLENEAIAPKPWQLLGESKAELRPENALLEEDLFFDHTTRQAPVITEETTRTLEDIIKQRIKDKAFDDVERKLKPVYDPSEYKKKLVLDQEKSKFSLAEIYEQEYLKNQEQQQQGPQSSSLADPVDDKPADDKAHNVIRKLMSDLFTKLDALSNFHYTPKMPMPEVKIVSNMPSITMEEIAPVTVSDGNLLAPEEVLDHVRGEVMGKTEKEKTDRLRERRKKKKIQHIRHQEQERKEKAVDKANPGSENKISERKAMRNLEQSEKEGTVTLIKDNKTKSLKSSTAFFAQLQDEVSSGIKATKVNSKKSKLAKSVTGSKLKL